MTTAVAKYAARKMFNSELNKFQKKSVSGPYDPYYEEIPHPRKPGKTKKVKKQIPAWIPEHDANILAKARKTAYRLDFSLFNLMGMRFGWSSVVGLVPVAGDLADGALALNLIHNMKGVDGGLPRGVLIRMVINFLIDMLIGFVPVLGDLADAAYKCNGKNVRLLEEHLDKKYKPKAMKELDDSLPAKRRPRPATVYEDFSDEEDERRETFNDRHSDVRQPTRAHSGRRDRLVDEEMGVSRQDTHRSQKEKPSRNGTRSSRRH